MTTGHVFIATSLDGFVARPDHRLDWLLKQDTAGEEHGYEAFMDSVDGIIMGRGSYQTVLGFGDWPYPKPVVVMSRSLTPDDVPEALADKVRLTQLDPPALMRSLAEQGWSRAYVDGGKVVQSFLRCGLVDDIELNVVPILIGEGIPLFSTLDADIDLELLGSTAYPSGCVQSRYRVRRGDQAQQA